MAANTLHKFACALSIVGVIVSLNLIANGSPNGMLYLVLNALIFFGNASQVKS